MAIIATIPALVCLLGLLIYALASNPKAVRIGEIMLFCGLFVTLFIIGGGSVVKIGGLGR